MHGSVDHHLGSGLGHAGIQRPTGRQRQTITSKIGAKPLIGKQIHQSTHLVDNFVGKLAAVGLTD
jgi:hypothetical protein